MPMPAFDVVVRRHAAFKHRGRRRWPHAGVDPRWSDVVAQLSLCCCCCFTFQLLKHSGDGLRLSNAIGLSFLILYQRDINEAVTNIRKDSEMSEKVFKVSGFILLRHYGFDVCLFVYLWRVDRLFVTSRLRDESTGWRDDLWQVDRVTSWLAAASLPGVLASRHKVDRPLGLAIGGIPGYGRDMSMWHNLIHKFTWSNDTVTKYTYTNFENFYSQQKFVLPQRILINGTKVPHNVNSASSRSLLPLRARSWCTTVANCEVDQNVKHSAVEKQMIQTSDKGKRKQFYVRVRPLWTLDDITTLLGQLT